MPWYVNVTRRTIRTVKADGSYVGFDPRVEVLVPAGQVSAEIADYVKSHKLRCTAPDPVVVSEIALQSEIEPLNVEVLAEPIDIYIPAQDVRTDEESNMLANSDIEGQPDPDSADGAPSRERRRRRKRH